MIASEVEDGRGVIASWHAQNIFFSFDYKSDDVFMNVGSPQPAN